MATSKPRLNLTLEPQLYALLKKLSEQQGTSMASIVVDLIETVAPVLERVSVAVEAAQSAQASVKENLVRTAEEAEFQLGPMMAEAMGQLDMFIEACHVAGNGENGAENPRPVITGVRSPQPPSLPTPKPTQKRAKKVRPSHEV